MRRPAAQLLLFLFLAAHAGAETLYGFFPSPPLVTVESVLATYKAIAEHGQAVLVARNVPWKDFAAGEPARSAELDELEGIVQLCRAHTLEPIFIVDPLNGLDRRRFMGLPAGWEPSFANPDVRGAMTRYALRIARQYKPRFLALASEINTYQDTHPEDFPAFLALYREIYAQVKAVSAKTQVFVTFQWDELNNLIPGVDGGAAPYETRWDQVEQFEPMLDVWAISTYPFIAYRSAREIPADYYSPLAARTRKPLAVAEGGYTTRNIGLLRGTPQDQVLFLRALHGQLGGRLLFWIHTVFADFSLESYAPLLKQQGIEADIPTLGWFAHVGLVDAEGRPKPGLTVWDSFRKGR